MNKIHWADEIAEKIIRFKGEKEVYTVASGITPSGTVHIGNFRELITVDLVKKALERKNKKVRFIFSWDNYDVFRKIPLNLPKEQYIKFEKHLGKPISLIPNPFGNINGKEGDGDSYAEYFQKQMENSIVKVDVHPEFLYQTKKYLNGDYVDNIRLVLQKKEEIKRILNKFRKTPLENDWYPVTIFCKNCSDNQLKIKSFDGENILYYHCEKCNTSIQHNLNKDFNLKLLWRIDWPMRWQYEKVDFEPGGKDHSSEGGSYDTAKTISKEIFNYEPPVYLRYDFVLIKGTGSKLSSSKGDVITLDDLLEIYEPEIIRWIFTSYRNNVDFSIAFDLDVIKTYENYDRMERQFYGKGEEISEKKKEKIKFIFELSQLNKNFYDSNLRQFPFRHLSNICQIYEFDLEKIIKFHEKKALPLNGGELKKLKLRVKLIKNWVDKYAPEEFKFSINKKKKSQDFIDFSYKKAIFEIKEIIKSGEYQNDDQAMFNYLYEIINRHHLEKAQFFKYLYLLLINKEQGPKLSSFINAIDKNKVINLL